MNHGREYEEEAKLVMKPFLAPHDLFLRLSSVEVALVLQYTRNGDRLTMGMTCKRILRDVLQPFSWKYADMVKMTDEQLIKQQKRAQLPLSLLRLAPIHLILLDEPRKDSSQLDLACIHHQLVTLEQNTLPQVPYETPPSVSFLLQQPATRHLRSLKLSSSPTPNDFDLIGALPHLTNLRLRHLDCSCNKPSAELIKLLTQLLLQPHFTELALVNTSFIHEADLQPLLSANSPGRLRSLLLQGACLSKRSNPIHIIPLTRLISPAFSQLEVFSLVC
jgi:hypothetical protein